MRGGRLLDAKDLQQPPWSLTRRQAYRVLEAVGVRISERRIVALSERVEDFFRGEGAAQLLGHPSESFPLEDRETATYLVHQWQKGGE